METRHLSIAIVSSLFACDASDSADRGDARADVATSGDTTTDVRSETSPGPLGQWIFHDVPGAVCANGSPTGLGVSQGESGVIVVYLSPGSACLDEGCTIGTPSMRKDGGFGADELAACVTGTCDGGVTFPSESIFDRGAATNPFRDATHVFISVCSGDYYVGDATHTFDGWTASFQGHANQRRFAAALAASFPDATRVVLTGGSAGAVGATLNYWQWVEAFDIRVDLIVDSFALVDPDGPEFRYDLHDPQLPPGCTTCADDYRTVYDFNAALAPDSRIALIDSEDDWTLDLATGYTYTEGLAALQPRLAALPNTRYFIADGNVHVLLKHPLDSASTDVDDADAGRHDLGEFLRLMQADDDAWVSWTCLAD